MKNILVREIRWQDRPAFRILFASETSWRDAIDSLPRKNILAAAPCLLVTDIPFEENLPAESLPASFILLAGGKSSRMGRDKASLPMLGSSLLQLQLDKARLLGADDILISGGQEYIPGTRAIPDILPERGPLGGLHACLAAAKHPACVVLTVDMPLLPVPILRELLERHQDAELTLAQHGEKWEPLVGVYASCLHARIAPMIGHGGAPVLRLIEASAHQFIPLKSDEILWANCNTPQDFEKMLSYFD